ncbi:recombinase family protein, partial [Streptosporangium canum]|uniref:recombinase family protein n=1 Tax=Streptosporangium canum TaxID=324952 RepID=UPI0037A5B328
MLAAFAEWERDLITARTLDGLEAARARGRSGGRKREPRPQSRSKDALGASLTLVPTPPNKARPLMTIR